MKPSLLALSSLTLALMLSPIIVGCSADAAEETATGGDALSTSRLAREYQGAIKDLRHRSPFDS